MQSSEEPKPINPFALPFCLLENRKELPPVPGVYLAIFTPDQEILYVGSTINLNSRWRSHDCMNQLRRFREFGEIKIAYFECNPSVLLDIENSFVHRFDPPLNGQSPVQGIGRKPKFVFLNIRQPIYDALKLKINESGCFRSVKEMLVGIASGNYLVLSQDAVKHISLNSKKNFCSDVVRVSGSITDFKIVKNSGLPKSKIVIREIWRILEEGKTVNGIDLNCIKTTRHKNGDISFSAYKIYWESLETYVFTETPARFMKCVPENIARIDVCCSPSVRISFSRNPSIDVLSDIRAIGDSIGLKIFQPKMDSLEIALQPHHSRTEIGESIAITIEKYGFCVQRMNQIKLKILKPGGQSHEMIQVKNFNSLEVIENDNI